MTYFIGLPQWQHTDWYSSSIKSHDALPLYAQHFSSIEGNSTFYGLPKAITLQTWYTQVTDEFRFCFKFPKAITHDAALQHCNVELKQYLQRMAVLQDKVGILWLQMNRHFCPEHLPILEKLFVQLPSDYQYGIEVRHLDFFDKAEHERRFNRLLLKYKVNRVMFDTHLLFQHAATDQISQEALRKKPRVPTHVLATANSPIVRLISPMNIQLAETTLHQWANKIIQWIDEGRIPYIFFHTPSNQQSPQLALRFTEIMQQLRPDIPAITLWSKQQPPQQVSLF
jgi:uncharacterized protein YecE (DUF72 family)